MDWRGQRAPVRANRERALLSHIWNWARERGLTKLANPCRGVRGFRERGRDIYVSDAVFAAVYAHASEPLRDAMDLAYLSGQRPADVLRLSWADVRDGVIALRQAKTGAALRIEVTPAVQDVLDRIAARQREARISDLAVIQGRDGRRLSAAALRGAFDRARRAAAAAAPALAAQVKAFQFRDLRAKAGTDQAERGGLLEARRQLGHSSVAMTEQYVRMGPRVKPTR